MKNGLGLRVLIVEDDPDVGSGEPNPDGVAGFKILRKPIDTDLFFREVFEILAPTRVKELEPD